MEIVEIEKLVRSQAATLAAAKGSLSLIERGLSRYGHAWDRPAIAAMDGDVCRGVLSLAIDEDEKSVTVRMAWCEPGVPGVLALLLLRLRLWCKARAVTEVFFTCHDNNSDMAKAAQALKAEPYSHTYRITL